MQLALGLVGMALVVFGAYVLIKVRDRPGGSVKAFGIEINSPNAGLPIMGLGVIALLGAAQLSSGGRSGQQLEQSASEPPAGTSADPVTTAGLGSQANPLSPVQTEKDASQPELGRSDSHPAAAAGMLPATSRLTGVELPGPGAFIDPNGSQEGLMARSACTAIASSQGRGISDVELAAWRGAGPDVNAVNVIVLDRLSERGFRDVDPYDGPWKEQFGGYIPDNVVVSDAAPVFGFTWSGATRSPDLRFRVWAWCRLRS